MCSFKLYSIQMTNFFNLTKIEDPQLESYYERSMQELNDFFGIKWKHHTPVVFVVNDRDTINILHGEETGEWIVGWVAGGSIVFVLNKDKFGEHSVHKYDDNDYYKLIKHEFAHLFFKVITGNKTGPKWLWEGVSILVSGQAEKWNKPTEFKGFLDGKDVYIESGYALQLLTEKYGKDQLLQFLNAYKDFDGDINVLFKETYSLDLNYGTFNGLLKD